uniref:Uncharacterized protein n=1 Tax=Arundo donax TaxID=35708 RepID=A0A0A9DV36_ARUDO
MTTQFTRLMNWKNKKENDSSSSINDVPTRNLRLVK